MQSTPPLQKERMTQGQAIKTLMDFKNELNLMEKFAGRAKLIKDIEKKLGFLIRYKAADNIPELFVKETNDKLSEIKGK